MQLTPAEEDMLAGRQGRAAQQAMEILVALGTIYGARRCIPVTSVQVAGVSYLNLGEAGLEFLEECSVDGRVQVPTLLNPAGMDLEQWASLGIQPEFAARQLAVVRALTRLGAQPTLTCTPYLIGCAPRPGEHVAWSESSAVAYANSVLGAHTNREGGPSALAAALTGRTPEYGLHLPAARQAAVRVVVRAPVTGTFGYGALGHGVGQALGARIPWFEGLSRPSPAELKSLAAALATFGGTPLFHIPGITTESTAIPTTVLELGPGELARSGEALSTGTGDPDFVALGCPHCSLAELTELVGLLGGRRVRVETWVTLARALLPAARQAGLLEPLAAAGVRVVADTCLAVAPLRERFHRLATNSAKGCYYGRASNGFAPLFGSTADCVEAAVTGRWQPTRNWP